MFKMTENIQKMRFSAVVIACEAAKSSLVKPQLAKCRVCRYMIHEAAG